jgi:LmbE family N-acetylglucosaminyl deacetylase
LRIAWFKPVFGKKKVGWKRRLLVWGVFLGVLTGAYYWQPLRYEFFPPDPPEQAPVTPSEAGLLKAGVRVLIVAGHPDDSEFYLGGTLLQMAAAGLKVRLVCMTDGDKSFYPFGVPEGLTETRRAEQRRAAEAWKGDVVFLGYGDGRLPVNARTVADLVDEIEKFKPDIVMAPDVLYRPRRSHSDHIDAGRNAERSLAVLVWKGTVALYNTRAPNCSVDITRDWQGKVELIRFHASQFGGSKQGFIETMLARRARDAGKESGVEMAENLRVYWLK